MLYGSYELQHEILQKIREIEKEQDFTVIYVGVVGSISKGITDNVSDYDVKFLFVRNGELLCRDKWHTEDQIRYRYFDNTKVYIGISIADEKVFFSAFLQKWDGG